MNKQQQIEDKEKQICVICHKDITSELPKIDIYGNHYCKDCYIEKCKYEFMNMRDTILINKELLKRELQFLEEQTRKYASKETAEKILNDIFKLEVYDDGWNKMYYKEHILELAKQFGIEIKENKNV